MKNSFLSFSILLFLLVGCEEKDVQQEKNDENEATEITNLETQIKELNSQIAELQSNIEINNNVNKELYNDLLLKNDQMEHIISQLPNIERKLGYIEQINHTDTETILHVQLVEMINDLTMPNNYRIEILGVENILLSKDSLFYVLDTVYPVKIAPTDELDEKINEYERLFKFSLINGKAVLITEVYLP